MAGEDPYKLQWLLWAKRPRTEPTDTSYHPIACHLVDVALVALALWDEVLPAATHRWLASALAVDEGAARLWVAFWAGLHDIGKASPPFQRKHRATQERLEAAGFVFPAHGDEPHGLVSAWSLRSELLPAQYGLSPRVAARVATVVGGHHGVLPNKGAIDNMHSDAPGFREWPAVRAILADMLAKAVGLEVSMSVPTALPNPAAMFVAGLISVADWIGSDDEHFFPYAAADETAVLALDWSAYVARSTVQARDALRFLRWIGPSPDDRPRTFGDLFPELAHYEPRGAQPAAINLAKQNVPGPMLAIIEAPMGEGKTEAAWYLADRWGASQQRRGIYVAMPTQATSNGMFLRVTHFLEDRYPGQEVILQLLHGHAALSAEFQTLIEAGRDLTPSNVEAAPASDGASASVVAGEWFAYRKRGVLAPFGVGTIDQALMAVLQSKHVFVRLFGLAGKTVILDEVHAYDTYMTSLLEMLLRWLAALDTSVILLSATLPASQRRCLLAAFAEGLGIAVTPTPPQASYPRLTWLSGAGAQAEHTPASDAQRKVVRIEWVDGHLPNGTDAFPLADRLASALADGGCAAIVCSTVNRAQDMYRALRAAFRALPEPARPLLSLLHARYPYDARAAREQDVLAWFGKGNAARPKRAVLIATQIIEQSLDLDFDLLVSDMAPVDLILQRLGRLHRHERGQRPAAVAQPTLWLYREERLSDGVPFFDPGISAIYDGYLLLRSWLALKGLPNGTIALPDQIEELVEAAYDDRAPDPNLSQAIQRRWQEAQEKHRTAQDCEVREAEHRWLLAPGSPQRDLAALLPYPREEDAPDLHHEHQALTRLGRPSVTLICLYGDEEIDRLSLTKEGEWLALGVMPTQGKVAELLRRSVSISQPEIYRHFVKQDVPPGWRKNSLLRHCRPVGFNAEQEWKRDGLRLRLDDELGLVIGGGREED